MSSLSTMLEHQRAWVVLYGITAGLLFGCKSVPSPTTTPTEVPPEEIPTVAVEQIDGTWKADPCQSPTDVDVDGVASADIFTWIDYNENGTVDEGEPPLPGVVYRGGDYGDVETDAGGRGGISEFKPGCACDCWEGTSILVEIPTGYVATTPTEIELTQDNETFSFGFRLDIGQLPSFPNEPDWYYVFYDHGLELTAFHYDDNGRINASFDTAKTAGESVFYENLFSVIHILRNTNRVTIREIEVTLVSSGRVLLCDIDGIEKDGETYSSSDLVSTYCRDL